MNTKLKWYDYIDMHFVVFIILMYGTSVLPSLYVGMISYKIFLFIALAAAIFLFFFSIGKPHLRTGKEWSIYMIVNLLPVILFTVIGYFIKP